MSLYDKYILPHLINLAMRNKEVARYRAVIIPQARGDVLEIGIGSGLNLPFYKPTVSTIYGVDPSEELLAMTKKRAARGAHRVELVTAPGENLPLGDASVDTVVMTFTLCSVVNAETTLGEAHRVLRPGGQLLFAEHGLSPDPGVRRWQDTLNPAWKKLAGGCNLNRQIDRLIERSGFRIDEISREYAKGPKPLAYVYCGRAAPAGPGPNRPLTRLPA